MLEDAGIFVRPAPARPECIGQLRYSKNSPVIQFLPLLRSHIRQETEIVLLNGDPTALRAKFAFRTMFIENQWRGQSAFLLFRCLYDGTSDDL